jgi:hypothetical protein
MKSKPEMQKWLPPLIAGLALASLPSLCSAAGPIILNTFDSNDLANWQANGSRIEWTNKDAAGSASSGSMMVYYTNSGAAGWQSAQPQRDLGPQAFNTSNYWSVSFDFKIDPASSPGADAPFGHVQVLPIDSGGNWLSGIGWTAITEEYTNWQHVEIGFQPPYTDLKALVVQVGDSGFTGDVIFYIDNLIINPIPSTLFVDQFTNASEADGWVYETWSQPGSDAWVSTPDAGGATPAGSLKLNCTFTDPPTPNTYQQVVFQKTFAGDPSRFTYLDLDVKLDPSSFVMQNGSTYGYFEVIAAINGDWHWLSLGGVNLAASDTNWTHLSYPLAGQALANGATNMQAIILKLGGGWAQDGFTNSVILYVDNVKLWTLQVPPTLTLRHAGPGGLQITSTAPTDDWQRQSIVTPASTRDYSWVNAGGPVTYSFTLTNFSDPIAHPGFEAHIYLVNYDTLYNQGFDETYPAVDWNAKDIVDVKFQNNASGGVDFSFNFKTNSPPTGANVDNNNIAVIHADSPLGRWAVTFENPTSVTLTTPSGASTNFVIGQEVANAFSGQMTLHFGTFKNHIINNGAEATFSRIQVTGVVEPFDETFPGPGLNSDPANPFWRLAADPAGIVWLPQGTAWWVDWGLPDTGYSMQMGPTVTGPWSAFTPSYTVTGATSKSAAIPTAGLPAGSAGFFRMANPNP